MIFKGATDIRIKKEFSFNTIIMHKNCFIYLERVMNDSITH